MSQFLSSRLFFASLFSFAFVPSVLWSKPVYFGGGFSYASDYFNQSYFLPMSVGLGRGGAKEEVARLNAKEQEVKDIYGGSPPAGVNPTFAQGGCPDVGTSMSSTSIEQGTNTVNIPTQYISIEGRGCAVSSASGSSLGLSGIEFDFSAQYEYLPWLFFRTGLTIGIPFPIRYSAGFQYSGDVNDIKVGPGLVNANGDPIGSVGAEVLVNSKAVVKYSGYHIQLPLVAGINLYQDKETSFYWAWGFNFSHASFVREVNGAQQITIKTKLSDDSPPSMGDYQTVKNEDRIDFAPGLLTIMGVRRRIQDNMFFYVEFRWHVGGSANIKTRGTQRRKNGNYASDTVAANFLESAFPGSVPQALQSPEARGGGRTANGLSLAYDMRLFFGITYLNSIAW